MLLDFPELRSEIDKSDMLSQIKSLPNQLEHGWFLGHKEKMPVFNQIKKIVIMGMDGSGIAANILEKFLESICEIPIIVINSSQLPVWVKGTANLVIASSLSGNSELVLAATRQAVENNCKILAISNGGKLFELAQEKNIPIWMISQQGSLQMSVGFLFSFYLSIIDRLGMIPDFDSLIHDISNNLSDLIKKLDDNIGTSKNPAKRMAIQMINRWIAIVGGGFMSPIAKHWTNQINLYSKCWAQFAELPESYQNLNEGLVFPDDLLPHTMVILLSSSFNPPEIQSQTESTKQSLMLAGVGTDLIHARGDNPLTQMFSNLLMGDFTAYYLALAYQVDPSETLSNNNC